MAATAGNGLAPSEKPASRYPQTRLSCSSETSGPCRWSLPARADVDFSSAVGDALDDSVEDFFFDVETRAGAAALSVIKEDALAEPAMAASTSTISEDHVGRFATEFQRDLL